MIILSKLITKNRIDLVIGIEYVNYYENNYNTNFFKDLYIEHKKSWNGLSDGIYKGEKMHLDRFNNLINSLKIDKTNNTVINVFNCNNEFWVKNGFHRTSILYYYGFKGKFNENKVNKINFGHYPTNIQFFQQRNFEPKYCNYTMQCFLKKYNKNFSTFIFFPNEKKLTCDQYNIINKYFIFEIEISLRQLKNNFKNNFIQLLYFNESWSIKNDRYKNKSERCFSEKGKLKIVFTEKIQINEITKIKENIRLYFNKGKHSIHTPDNQEENDRILDLLNYNTILFMNKTPSLYINFLNFNKLFNDLKLFCKENNIDTNKICITSSSVLSVYGIRDCGDMDLFIDNKYIDIFKKTPFDNHNKYTIDKHYSKHFEDIIYNPDNHFYFQGIKFCNLNIIEDYKKYRIENSLYSKKSIEKDKKDINSIIEIIK